MTSKISGSDNTYVAREKTETSTRGNAEKKQDNGKERLL